MPREHDSLGSQPCSAVAPAIWAIVAITAASGLIVAIGRYEAHHVNLTALPPVHVPEAG